MPHKFDISSKNKLDNPKRREILPPHETLVKLGLKAGDVVADIGCGIGYFSIPAAEIVGQKGIVYATDISLEMIEVVETKAAESNVINIRPIVTGEYDLKLADNSVSFAFMCTVLHEIEDKVRFINEAKRILVQQGRIAIVEWSKKNSDWGPPIDHRLEGDTVKQTLQDCGFKDMSVTELNEYFYIVTAVK